MRIIDLAPGLGARAIAFQKVGFQVVYAASDDGESAGIYNLLYIRRYIIANIDPETLPEADFIMAQLVTEPRVKYEDKKAYLRSQNGGAVNCIIHTKTLDFCILEMSARFLAGSNRGMAEEVLTDYIGNGYSFFI